MRGEGSRQEDMAAAQSDAEDGKRDAWGDSGAMDGEAESVVVGSGAGATCRANCAFLAAAMDSVVGSVWDVVVVADREQHLEAVAVSWGGAAFHRVLSEVAGVGDFLETLWERRSAVAAPGAADGSGSLPHHCYTPLLVVDMMKAGHAAHVQVDPILLLLLLLVSHHCGRGYHV